MTPTGYAPQRTSAPRNPWLAAGLTTLGVGLAALSLLGPLVLGVVRYHVTETLRNQTIGLDAVSLLIVAPLSLFAALLVLRRHLAGAALALGVAAYTTYVLVQYILGPEYERLPGNNEVLFPLYLVMFALGWLVGLAAWNAFDVTPIRTNEGATASSPGLSCRFWRL